MRALYFGILSLGLGGWCVIGLPSGNGTVRNGGGGGIRVGVDCGEDGGRVDATTLTRSWVAGSDANKVVGTAGPTETTLVNIASENILPNMAVIASHKDWTIVSVTETLAAQNAHSLNSDFTSTKATATIERNMEGPSTTLDAETYSITKESFEVITITTTTKEEDVEGLSIALSAKADSITKDFLSVITSTTTTREEEVEKLSTLLTLRTSLSGEANSGHRSSEGTSTRSRDPAGINSSTPIATASASMKKIDTTTAFESSNLETSTVSSGCVTTSLPTEKSGDISTSARKGDEVTGSRTRSADAEVTSKSMPSDATTQDERTSSSGSTVSNTAEPKTTKSADLEAFVVASSGAEEPVFRSTKSGFSVKTSQYVSTSTRKAQHDSSTITSTAEAMSESTTGREMAGVERSSASVSSMPHATTDNSTETESSRTLTVNSGSLEGVAGSVRTGLSTGTRTSKDITASTSQSGKAASTTMTSVEAEEMSKNMTSGAATGMDNISLADESMLHTSSQRMSSSASFKTLIASSTSSQGRVSVSISLRLPIETSKYFSTSREAESATSTYADPEVTSRIATGFETAELERIILSADNATSAAITPANAEGTSERTTGYETTAIGGIRASASSMHQASTDKTTESASFETLRALSTGSSEPVSESTREAENTNSTVITSAEAKATSNGSTPSGTTQLETITLSFSSISLTPTGSLTKSASFETLTTSTGSSDRVSRSTGPWQAASSVAAMQDRSGTLVSSFTQHDGSAEEFDGPLKTSSHQLLTGSIRITSTSSTASTMATQTTYSRSPSLTTSSTLRSSSFGSSSTLTSSMRPKMTDCVDNFDFFEMTDANLAESGTIAWYADWTSRASSDPASNSMGEVPYFGRIWLRNPDYNCGLELGGCTQRPSCNEILKLYPGDPEMARRVYFTMKMQATVNQVMKSYYDATHLAQTNLASVMKKIVDTSFQSTSMDDLQACQFLKTAYNNMYNLMAELAMPILNGKQGLGGDWFRGPVRSPENPSAEGVRWLQFADPYGQKNQGFSFWKGKAKTSYRWWMQEALGSMAASTGMCEGLGMVNLNKGGAEESMRTALLKISQFQRKELSQHVQNLNHGAFQGEGDMSALAGMLGMGIWSNESSSAVDLLTDPYQLEEMMTTQSKDALLSRAYLLNKCYLKCTTHPHASLLCKGFNDWEFAHKHAMKHGYPYDSDHPGPGSKMSAAEKLMRICPEPNKVCQVECWSQEKKGFTQPLHNIGQLGSDPLDVDIQEKMREIYAYYKEHGNANPHPEDVVKVEENPSGKLTGEYRGPHFWLPVCDSEQGYTHIVDFGQQKHGKHHFDQFSRSQDRRSFPISCGNYRSDQTPEFMEAMGLTNWHTKGVSWTMNPFFKNYAALNAAILIEAPLDNFLALCRLGVQYPQSDTKDTKNGQMDIRRESSQFCAPIDEETQGMPWFLANLWFCKKAEAAKALFRIQGPSGGIMGLGKVKNHRRLCERWLATWEGEQMVGIEETDGGQGKDRWIGPKHKVKVGEMHKFSYDNKGKAFHPKWRDSKDLIGSVLLGKRGEAKLGYEAAAGSNQEEGERGVPESLSQCKGTEGIGFGWRFMGLLVGRGGSKAMGQAWKFLFTGHRDLRRYGSKVEFEGYESTCPQVKERLWGQDTLRKRGVDDGVGKENEEASDKLPVVVEIDMEEVRREEAWYWKEIEEVMKEDEEVY